MRQLPDKERRRRKGPQMFPQTFGNSRSISCKR
ncbi:MAG: hypothetical protein QOF70_4261 [Acetobacteraceae bacterium]|jgi:hypothetical protein|nr:hypothetical protein [Acetobacteraceae bacterium]